MGEHPVQSQKGGKLSAQEIADNFSDLHPPLNAQQVQVEASRCLCCYDAPCVTASPNRCSHLLISDTSGDLDSNNVSITYETSQNGRLSNGFGGFDALYLTSCR